MGYIYLVTNKINGRRYVGQTQRIDIEMRWRDHKREKPAVGSYLYAAYKKYGIDNFKFQIICICFDEDCNKYEEGYIQRFNTMRPNGYNLKTGGNNSKMTDETKQLISKRQKEIMTDERRKILSECHKGIRISEEHKKIISIKQKELWKNMSAEEKKKYIQNRFKNKSDGTINTISDKAREALQKRIDENKKRVGKFDDNGTLLESFESISHASRATNACITTISRVCRGVTRYNKSGGFIWKFI